MPSASDLVCCPPSRRRVLLVGVGATVVAAIGSAAACTDDAGPDDDSPGGPDGPGSDRQDPDASELTGTSSSLKALIGAYVATERAHPDAAERLARLRAIHERHLATVSHAASVAERGPVGPKALQPRDAQSTPSPNGSPSSSANPTGTGSPSPSPEPSEPNVPKDRSNAINALVSLEHTSAKTRRIELGEITSGQVARLLATIAAANQAHAAYLEKGVSDG